MSTPAMVMALFGKKPKAKKNSLQSLKLTTNQKISKPEIAANPPQKSVPPDAKKPSVVRGVSAAKTKNAEADVGDAQDSDTVSDDSHSEERPVVYRQSLKQARTDTPARKRAREAGLLKHPSALHSDVLDAAPGDGSVSMDDFDLKREVNPPRVAGAVSAAAVTLGGAAAGEELAAIAVKTKQELGVATGKADRELAKRSIAAFEQEKGREADYFDAKEIKAGMQVQRKVDEKAARKRKWEGRLSDIDAARIAGPEAAQDTEMVRSRIEANNYEERCVRKAALARESVVVPLPEVREDGDPRVDVSEVRTSGTGHTQSAHSTTPAPGTEQRKIIEAQLKQLDDNNVVVSEHTRASKMATGVPPALPVQGRRLDPPEHATGALIYGNGATVQTPIDYALEALVNKSTSHETRVQDSLEQMYHMLLTATKRFYDVDAVVPEDSEFKQKPREYAAQFKTALHAHIDRWFNPGTDKNNSLRRFLADRFVGDTADERREKLRKKLLDDPPSAEEREALTDAVLVGAKNVASAEDDVNDAAKRAAMQWQVDAEVAALTRAMPDITDSELAEQQASNVRPEDHVILSRIREHAANDALYRVEDDAPITLMRQNETVFGAAAGAEDANVSTTGHERSVMAEARRLYSEVGSSTKYMDMLRSETTRNLRRSRAELDQLVEKSALYTLSSDELKRFKVLTKAIEDAEVAAQAAHNRAIIEHYGHPDAAAAYESACNSSAAQLEERTRADLDNYLREPYGDERPCANDMSCIGREIDESGQTTLRELLSLSEEAVFLTEGTLPRERRFCFLCELYQTTNEFMKLKDQKNSGGVRLRVLQRFKTVFDRPGEYSSETCNLAAVLHHRAYGIVAPFPAFDRSNYKFALREVKVAKNVNAKTLAAERSSDASAKNADFEVHSLRGFVEMPSMLFREASDATAL